MIMKHFEQLSMIFPAFYNQELDGNEMGVYCAGGCTDAKN